MIPLFREVLDWHLFSTNPSLKIWTWPGRILDFMASYLPASHQEQVVSTVARPAHLRTSTAWGATGGLS